MTQSLIKSHICTATVLQLKIMIVPNLTPFGVAHHNKESTRKRSQQKF